MIYDSVDTLYSIRKDNINKVMRWILCVLLPLCSCGTAMTQWDYDQENGTPFQRKLNKRIGQNINDVVLEKGIPSRTFAMPDGTSLYDWYYSYGTTVSRGWFGNYSGSENTCRVEYAVGKDSKISAWKIDGNSCPH